VDKDWIREEGGQDIGFWLVDPADPEEPHWTGTTVARLVDWDPEDPAGRSFQWYVTGRDQAFNFECFVPVARIDLAKRAIAWVKS
jgi:hypothetical protein